MRINAQRVGLLLSLPPLLPPLLLLLLPWPGTYARPTPSASSCSHAHRPCKNS